MAGIIRWNELWRMARLNSQKRKREDVISYWNNRAESFNETTSLEQSIQRAKTQVSKMDLNPEDTVLDIGSGNGRLAIPIAKKVKSVTAIEPSQEYLSEFLEKENNGLCLKRRSKRAMIWWRKKTHACI